MKAAQTFFNDRTDAAHRLAEVLRPYAGPDTVVLALPRGGVPVGFEVAKDLGVPLNVIVARKIGVPQDPEVGIGAVAEDGIGVVDPLMAAALGIGEDRLRQMADKEMQETERRAQLYRGEPLDVKGKTVLLVDDGIATGITALAAARSLREKGARRIVLAAPVCAQDSVHCLREEVDDIICLHEPEYFESVGRWYRHFPQLTDDEVLRFLAEARDPHEGYGGA